VNAPDTEKKPQPPAMKRARISYRETPDAGFGKPRTVHEIREAADPEQLHELFWANPSWPTGKTRKAAGAVLMGTVGEDDYPADWKHESGDLITEEIAAWADKQWPLGTRAKWPTLGVPAELS
jgi:hypothetical protein